MKSSKRDLFLSIFYLFLCVCYTIVAIFQQGGQFLTVLNILISIAFLATSIICFCSYMKNKKNPK